MGTHIQEYMLVMHRFFPWWMIALYWLVGTLAVRRLCNATVSRSALVGLAMNALGAITIPAFLTGAGMFLRAILGTRPIWGERLAQLPTYFVPGLLIAIFIGTVGAKTFADAIVLSKSLDHAMGKAQIIRFALINLVLLSLTLTYGCYLEDLQRRVR